MTTKEAFIQALNTRGLFSRCGIAPNHITNVRARIKNGHYPTHETMTKWLSMAGYTCIPEQWTKNI